MSKVARQHEYPVCNSGDVEAHERRDIVIVEVYECNECGKIF